MASNNHLSRVAALGCILCDHLGAGETPATVHHIREEAGLRNDYLSIPLCREHHQGASGRHMLGASGFYQRYKVTELDLLAMTIARLMP